MSTEEKRRDEWSEEKGWRRESKSAGQVFSVGGKSSTSWVLLPVLRSVWAGSVLSVYCGIHCVTSPCVFLVTASAFDVPPEKGKVRAHAHSFDLYFPYL